jgi:hypothetical protein
MSLSERMFAITEFSRLLPDEYDSDKLFFEINDGKNRYVGEEIRVPRRTRGRKRPFTNRGETTEHGRIFMFGNIQNADEVRDAMVWYFQSGVDDALSRRSPAGEFLWSFSAGPLPGQRHSQMAQAEPSLRPRFAPSAAEQRNPKSPDAPQAANPKMP